MYWSSFMTSSMQLAKECLSQRLTDEQAEGFQPLEGLEKFAETIETGIVSISFYSEKLQIMKRTLLEVSIYHASVRYPHFTACC